MDRNTFLIALLGLPVLFSDYEKRQVWPVKKVDGHRLRRGKNPPEPYRLKGLSPRHYKPESEPDTPRPWQKNYNPEPLQYWGTEPIEDTDLLG